MQEGCKVKQKNEIRIKMMKSRIIKKEEKEMKEMSGSLK